MRIFAHVMSRYDLDLCIYYFVNLKDMKHYTLLNVYGATSITCNITSITSHNVSVYIRVLAQYDLLGCTTGMSEDLELYL